MIFDVDGFGMSSRSTTGKGGLNCGHDGGFDCCVDAFGGSGALAAFGFGIFSDEIACYFSEVDINSICFQWSLL